MEYIDFLKSKMAISSQTGFDVSEGQLTPTLYPHVKDTVRWAVRGGCRAIFSSFGMQKTCTQLEILRIITEQNPGTFALVVCPKRVVVEFVTQAKQHLDMTIQYVRNMEEVRACETKIMVTNYERVRDGEDGVRIDPDYFIATSLDEASVLRGFGTKTYQEFLPLFANVKYRFVATATPSPNRYKELIHYAGYLGVMDTGQALTRFFQRDSTKANNLTLYPGKEREYWLWVSTWALFLTKPSDLGYPDDGYELPPLYTHEEVVEVDNESAGYNQDGEKIMFREAALGLQQAAKERRDNMPNKVSRIVEIINRPENKDDHFLIWHDLEDERKAICAAIPGCKAVYGSQDEDEADQIILDFKEGRLKYLAAKPEMLGEGLNFQYHCHKAIMFIDYRFNDKFQAIARIHRFMQQYPVDLYLIYAESEQEIYKTFMQKWKQHNEMVERMAAIVRDNGLFGLDVESKLMRYMFSKREEQKGNLWQAINNDNVLECKNMADNSVDLIVTSVPFSNHYEYTASYNDFGFNADNDEFFRQMDYLTPELLRILKPGRVCAIHCKDRILFGNATKLGMPSLDPFHAMCIFHYMKHGFVLFGMITVDTDVVRENNQTYRLGYTEMCKDGSKMGVGCPEYILLFRKLPTDTSRAYADEPVTKDKSEYSLARWQIDAHADWKSSGDRLLLYEDCRNLGIDGVRNYFRNFSKEHIYNYEQHVAFAEELEVRGKLPKTFMAVDPVSHKDFIWDDITRMRTLNTRQSQANRQNHICLAKGSLILTRNGFKEIQDIALGDMVLTHKGNWKPVIGKRCTGMNPVVQTKAQGVANLITTPDHKLWCRKSDKVRRKDYMRITKPTWIEAKDTKNGFVNLKLPECEESSLSSLEWWLVGRYLADGHYHKERSQFFISVGEHKIDEFSQMLENTEWIGAIHPHDGCSQIGLKKLPERLAQMLHNCGYGAVNKQVPIEGLCLNEKLSESLLCGYLSGDGCKVGNATMACSVSRALMLGMAMVAQRARGAVASVYASKKAGKHTILGREVNQLQLWVLSWREGHHKYGEILYDGAWKPVTDIIDCGEAETWSIQVADDASYTAEGCIVKNCPLQLDIVERLITRYSNKGDMVFDPFGGIGTVPYCAVKLGRKGLSTELNYDYWRDGLTYLKEAEMEMTSPTLFDFMDAI
ncbi:MAG: DNA methylase N-4 [Prevotella sp.]|nr:DNA methylase N-4 [Prevotella sp.]